MPQRRSFSRCRMLRAAMWRFMPGSVKRQPGPGQLCRKQKPPLLKICHTPSQPSLSRTSLCAVHPSDVRRLSRRRLCCTRGVAPGIFTSRRLFNAHAHVPPLQSTMAGDGRYRYNALFHHAKAQFSAVIAEELQRLCATKGLTEAQAFRELLRTLPLQQAQVPAHEVQSMCRNFNLSKPAGALSFALRPAVSAASAAAQGCAATTVQHLCSSLRVAADSAAGTSADGSADDEAASSPPPHVKDAKAAAADPRKRTRAANSAAGPTETSAVGDAAEPAQTAKRARRVSAPRTPAGGPVSVPASPST